ncbi:MAG: hypothetical protein V3W18_06135 [candidate division Zixibacteria bacterium]
MLKTRLLRILIYIINLSVSCVIVLSCILCNSCSPSRIAENAEKSAYRKLKYYLQDICEIDVELFDGPELLRENEDDYVFIFHSMYPEYGVMNFEVSVPKDKHKNIDISAPSGERKRFNFLCETTRLPVKKAALSYLFNLPISQDTTNPRIKRLQTVELDKGQFNDIVNFVEIKRELFTFAACHGSRNPDNLQELQSDAFSKSTCRIRELDSLYIHDRYGQKYYYQNLINFVLLGSPGQNLKWDFNAFELDSLYNDDLEHILVDGDDIMVKLKPFR